MPDILVRDVPQRTLDALKERAKRNRRSLQQEHTFRALAWLINRIKWRHLATPVVDAVIKSGQSQ